MSVRAVHCPLLNPPSEKGVVLKSGSMSGLNFSSRRHVAFFRGGNSDALPNCGEKSIEIERFLKKLGGKTVRTADRWRRERRDDKDWQTGPLHVFVEEKIPAADRAHAQVCDHQIRLVFCEVFKRFLAVPGGDYLPALGYENAGEAGQHGGIVIDQQDDRPVVRVAGRTDGLQSGEPVEEVGGGMV